MKILFTLLALCTCYNAAHSYIDDQHSGREALVMTLGA